MMNIRQIGIIAAVGAAVLIAPLAASANGFGENRPWQFRTPASLAALLFQAELMEKVDANGFGPGNVINNIGTLNQNSSQAIGNYNVTTIGEGACNGQNACTVHTDQDNADSPTTAIGVGSNETNISGKHPHNTTALPVPSSCNTCAN